MPERVNSFAVAIFGPIVVSLATLAAGFGGPALAGDACIEKLPQPLAEGPPWNALRNHATCYSCYFTTEVLLWDVRRAKGRACWFLRDAYGRDVTKAHVRPGVAPAPTSTLSSKLASWFGAFDLAGASANAAPKVGAPQINASGPSRRYQADIEDAKKTDGSVGVGPVSNGGARVAQRVSRASTPHDDRVLYNQFLRWRERRKIIDEAGPSPVRQ